MLVGGFQRNSLVDFPGIVASVIFLAGCNFRCPYCHNPSLVLGQGEEIPLIDILTYLSKAKKIIDGVCVTGGEPTLYGEKLIHLIDEIRALGLKVKLDTNGSHPELLQRLIKEKKLDYVALDLKTSFERYPELALDKTLGHKVEESFSFLQDQNEIPYEFRTTLDPRVVCFEDLKKLAKGMKPQTRWFWQQFKNQNCLENAEDVSPYLKEDLLHFQTQLSSHPLQITLR